MNLSELAPNLSKISEHLAALPNVKLHRAFVLNFGKRECVALRYSDTREHTPGTPAYERGERTYTHEALYVLGELPSAYVQRKARVFRHSIAHGRDLSLAPLLAGLWYVAGYSTPASQKKALEAGHYDGPHFYLFRDSGSESIEARKIGETSAQSL